MPWCSIKTLKRNLFAHLLSTNLACFTRARTFAPFCFPSHISLHFASAPCCFPSRASLDFTSLRRSTSLRRLSTLVLAFAAHEHSFQCLLYSRAHLHASLRASLYFTPLWCRAEGLLYFALACSTRAHILMLHFAHRFPSLRLCAGRGLRYFALPCSTRAQIEPLHCPHHS